MSTSRCRANSSSTINRFRRRPAVFRGQEAEYRDAARVETLDMLPSRLSLARQGGHPTSGVVVVLCVTALTCIWCLGCAREEPMPTIPGFPPNNHSPTITNLLALPDTIGPSDSTVVHCLATDPDGDALVFDWQTDARLDIQGTPTWNKYLNEQPSSSHTFYNADLSNPINDSAWVYCSVRDPWGGGASRHVFVILRRQ